MVTDTIDLKPVLEKALHYKHYRDLVDELVLQNKTTGNTQSEAYSAFTKLNVQRMNRLDKTIQIEGESKNHFLGIKTKQIWLVIGDAWCGDCAQIIPVINKMASINETNIDFRIISRDEFPELIQAYQTNGTNSIPKLLIIDAKNYEVIKTWGPRPEPAIEILKHWKANLNIMTKEDFEKELHLWYAKDRGHSIIKEITHLLNINNS